MDFLPRLNLKLLIFFPSLPKPPQLKEMNFITYSRILGLLLEEQLNHFDSLWFFGPCFTYLLCWVGSHIPYICQLALCICPNYPFYWLFYLFYKFHCPFPSHPLISYQPKINKRKDDMRNFYNWRESDRIILLLDLGLSWPWKWFGTSSYGGIPTDLSLSPMDSSEIGGNSTFSKFTRILYLLYEGSFSIPLLLEWEYSLVWHYWGEGPLGVVLGEGGFRRGILSSRSSLPFLLLPLLVNLCLPVSHFNFSVVLSKVAIFMENFTFK